MKFKYKMILSIILLLLTFSIYICFNYREFINTIGNIFGDKSIVLALDDLSVNFLTGDEISYEKGEYIKEFSVSNVTDNDVYYDLSLINIINNTNGKEIRVEFSSTNEGFNLKDKEFPVDDEEIAKSVKIAPHDTQRYTLKITGDTLDKGEILSAKIYISVNDRAVVENPFAILIKKNNDVKGEDSESGLIKGIEDAKDTYYFKGNVTNNYVSFAAYNWRIVRITGDNNVKLILDEDLADLIKPYNDSETYNSASEAMTLSNATGYKDLTDWYNANLSSYDDIIDEVKYNTDVAYSSSGNVNGLVKYSVLDRIFDGNNKPVFNRSGVATVSKIGLISADELALAGLNSKSDNESNYLYNENIVNNTFTYTPYSYSETNGVINMVVMMSNGKINYQSIKDKGSLRPVIEINANVNVKGTGTKDDPYVLN